MDRDQGDDRRRDPNGPQDESPLERLARLREGLARGVRRAPANAGARFDPGGVSRPTDSAGDADAALGSARDAPAWDDDDAYVDRGRAARRVGGPETDGREWRVAETSGVEADPYAPGPFIPDAADEDPYAPEADAASPYYEADIDDAPPRGRQRRGDDRDAGARRRAPVDAFDDDAREAPREEEEDAAWDAPAPRARAGEHKADDPSLVRSMLRDIRPAAAAAPATEAAQTESYRRAVEAPTLRDPRPGPETRRPAARDVDAETDEDGDDDGGWRAPPPRASSGRQAARPRTARLHPFSGVERLLAGRYLRARRKEGFISVIVVLSLIGITLGVATLIVVMSVMNGFRAELVRKIVGVNGHLTVLPVGAPFDDYPTVAQNIAAVPGVVRAAPLIEGQAFASTERTGVGVLVRGLAQSDLLTLEKVAVTPERAIGSLAEFEASRGVALGERLAAKLGVTIGDNVTLLSPRGPSTPFGSIPRRRAFEVLYIFKVGVLQYDEAVVFMPLPEAQKFFNKDGVVDAIEVMVATPEQLDGYREDIEAAAERPTLIDDWMRLNGQLIGALKTERTVMFLILSMLILIASLIIISGLIMLVKEKGPNIAILRTMGMSKGAVMRVFFMAGATIGLVGTVMGVALGVLFVSNIDVIKIWVEYFAGVEVFPEEIYSLSSLPAELHWEDVWMTVGIALGLSFLATLYPAWRAARMDPVEALRNE